MNGDYDESCGVNEYGEPMNCSYCANWGVTRVRNDGVKEVVCRVARPKFSTGVDEDFSARLLRLMGERDMSGMDLAHASGVHSNTIYNITSGKCEPELKTLRKIRRGLVCSWDELLGR